MPSNAELYGVNPPDPDQTGPGYGDIPLKKANPWAMLAVKNLAPTTVAGGNKDFDYGDNLAMIGAGLHRQFPDAETPKQQLDAVMGAYGFKSPYSIADKSSFPGKDSRPNLSETVNSTVYIPTAEQLKNSKEASAEFYGTAASGLRPFGVMAHEGRHLIDLSTGFKPDEDQETQDMWGNQLNHLAGGYDDRSMANALRALNLSQQPDSPPIPDDVRTINPWMGKKEHPTAQDLMQWIGKQPGYKGGAS